MESGTRTNGITLLPCPFCGGEAYITSDYSSERDETRWSLWHECCQHEGEGAGYGRALFPWFETPWYKTEAEAAEAWNTRAERTCHAYLKGFDPHKTVNTCHYACSACGYAINHNDGYCKSCGAKVVD